MSLLDSLLGGYVFAQQSGAPSAVPSRRTLIFAGATVVDDGPTANSTTILISGGGGSFPGGDLCSGTGTSVAVGSGLVLASGTLTAPSPFVHASTQLLDGTGLAVTVGSGLSLAAGTLTASGAGGATLIAAVPSTQFLCHFNGSGSSFANNGFLQGLSFGSIGSVTQTTAQAKFGSGSLLCDGNASNGLYVNNSSGGIALGTGAWTWECWVYPNLFGPYDGILCGANTGDYQGPIMILAGGVLYAYGSSSGSGWSYIINSGYTLPLSTWSHVALVADGAGNLSLYANGSRFGTTTVGNVFCSGKIWIGHYPYFPVGALTLDGYVDEVRLSNVAQYSGATYTVPASSFANGQAAFPPGAAAGDLAYCPGYLFTCLGSGSWQYNQQAIY